MAKSKKSAKKAKSHKTSEGSYDDSENEDTVGKMEIETDKTEESNAGITPTKKSDGDSTGR